MPGDDGERPALADHGHGLLADRELLTRTGSLPRTIERGAERLVQHPPMARGARQPHDVLVEDHGPGVGPYVGDRPPVPRPSRHPQDQVGEGQVGDELPVPDDVVQPLDSAGSGSAVEERRASARVVTTGEPNGSGGQVEELPARTTERRVRRATESAAMLGLSSRWIPASEVRRPLDDVDVGRRPRLEGVRGLAVGPTRRSPRGPPGHRLEHRVEVVAQRAPGQGVPAVLARAAGSPWPASCRCRSSRR